jgi:hypothetical protein
VWSYKQRSWLMRYLFELTWEGYGTVGRWEHELWWTAILWLPIALNGRVNTFWFKNCKPACNIVTVRCWFYRLTHDRKTVIQGGNTENYQNYHTFKSLKQIKIISWYPWHKYWSWFKTKRKIFFHLNGMKFLHEMSVTMFF